MKRILATAAALAVVGGVLAVNGGEQAVGSPTQVDFVDMGSPASEAGHKLKSWGPIEPDTNGGNWGGMGAGGCGVDHGGGSPSVCDAKTRVMWQPGGSPGSGLTLYNPGGMDGGTLVIRYLDGLADDSFDVFVRGKKVASIIGETDGVEDWHTTHIDLSTDLKGKPIHLKEKVKIKFKATGAMWSGHSTWGQVAIDWVKLER